MSRHTAWTADEVLERITAEFDAALADFDELLGANQEALGDFTRLIAP